ncbi:Desulfoferrodoxin [Fusobacterium necrogenes]|uniref:Desulfoferrodoxin n=1 Tax=Fusobacterium necrogenes TaxID=858 RepID=A0A377GZL6_9FUSO|nr:desulfoferrodoxin family protein [Fusobacterium necrogenes]STO32303.1 Desulfoferrodoxin [Fusobacterium necrogenes]
MRKDFIKLECGALAQVISGEGCDKGVEVISAKTQDAATEKHVPYVEEKENGYLVRIGKDAKHPMLAEHYIEFIELEVDGDTLYRKYLKPEQEPEAFFEVPKGKEVIAREYCNIHGLWINK